MTGMPTVNKDDVLKLADIFKNDHWGTIFREFAAMLEPGVEYLLLVEAGHVKGEHKFTISVSNGSR